MKDSTKKLLLAITIGTSFTFAAYSFLFPAHLVPEEQQVAIEAIIDDGCPGLRPLYDINLEEDGRVSIGIVEDIMYMCTSEMKREMFYNALVREFSKNY